MKKYNFKFAALALIAALTISSCAVHNRDHRGPRHDRHDDRRGDDRHDGDRRGNDRNNY